MTAPFRRFVVVDVISEVNIDQESLLKLSETVLNIERFVQTNIDPDGQPKIFLIAPRNSIIAQEITGGQGREESDGPSYQIMYPLFSSHLSLPLKPGEQVWGMQETDIDYFWVSRIHEPIHVEDANYTHGDRIGTPAVQNALEFNMDEGTEVSTVPGFPNGDAFQNRESDVLSPDDEFENTTLEPQSFTFAKIDGYELIVKESKQSDAIVYEPVPRLSKRPGDLVLQGSNNASIVLGTERGFGKTTRPTPDASSVSPESDEATSAGLSEGMGAIDIVVGRGRIHDGAVANVDSDPQDTRPRVVSNIRENLETNKNIGLDDKKAPDGPGLIDVAEGDPDLLHDASRVYMSMKTNPDTLLGLEFPDVDSETTVDPAEDCAAIITKSDQIRIIARKDEDNSINGSIRIIKEGDTDADRATIVMLSDGTIMIDGPKIIIGSGFQAANGTNGAGSQVVIGRDATEPIVLGNVLLEKLVALETAFNNHVHNSGAGPTTMHHATGGGAGVQSAEFAAPAPPPPEPGAEPGAAPPVPGRTILSKVGKTK